MAADPHGQAGRLCAKCGQRPGTIKWSEGVIAQLHGAYEWWCKGCALRAQINHAEERADALSELRQQLAEWEAS